MTEVQVHELTRHGERSPVPRRQLASLPANQRSYSRMSSKGLIFGDDSPLLSPIPPYPRRRSVTFAIDTKDNYREERPEYYTSYSASAPVSPIRERAVSPAPMSILKQHSSYGDDTNNEDNDNNMSNVNNDYMVKNNEVNNKNMISKNKSYGKDSSRYTYNTNETEDLTTLTTTTTINQVTDFTAAGVDFNNGNNKINNNNNNNNNNNSINNNEYDDSRTRSVSGANATSSQHHTHAAIFNEGNSTKNNRSNTVNNVPYSSTTILSDLEASAQYSSYTTLPHRKDEKNSVPVKAVNMFTTMNDRENKENEAQRYQSSLRDHNSVYNSHISNSNNSSNKSFPPLTLRSSRRVSPVVVHRRGRSASRQRLAQRRREAELHHSFYDDSFVEEFVLSTKAELEREEELKRLEEQQRASVLAEAEKTRQRAEEAKLSAVEKAKRILTSRVKHRNFSVTPPRSESQRQNLNKCTATTAADVAANITSQEQEAQEEFSEQEENRKDVRTRQKSVPHKARSICDRENVITRRDNNAAKGDKSLYNSNNNNNNNNNNGAHCGINYNNTDETLSQEINAQRGKDEETKQVLGLISTEDYDDPEVQAALRVLAENNISLEHLMTYKKEDKHTQERPHEHKQEQENSHSHIERKVNGHKRSRTHNLENLEDREQEFSQTAEIESLHYHQQGNRKHHLKYTNNHRNISLTKNEQQNTHKSKTTSNVIHHNKDAYSNENEQHHTKERSMPLISHEEFDSVLSQSIQSSSTSVSKSFEQNNKNNIDNVPNVNVKMDVTSSQSVKDSKTLIHNKRRKVEEIVNQLLQRQRQSRSKRSVVVINWEDIDPSLADSIAEDDVECATDNTNNINMHNLSRQASTTEQTFANDNNNNRVCHARSLEDRTTSKPPHAATTKSVHRSRSRHVSGKDAHNASNLSEYETKVNKASCQRNTSVVPDLDNLSLLYDEIGLHNVNGIDDEDRPILLPRRKQRQLPPTRSLSQLVIQPEEREHSDTYDNLEDVQENVNNTSYRDVDNTTYNNPAYSTTHRERPGRRKNIMFETAEEAERIMRQPPKITRPTRRHQQQKNELREENQEEEEQEEQEELQEQQLQHQLHQHHQQRQQQHRVRRNVTNSNMSLSAYGNNMSGGEDEWKQNKKISGNRNNKSNNSTRLNMKRPLASDLFAPHKVQSRIGNQSKSKLTFKKQSYKEKGQEEEEIQHHNDNNEEEEDDDDDNNNNNIIEEMPDVDYSHSHGNSQTRRVIGENVYNQDELQGDNLLFGNNGSNNNVNIRRNNAHDNSGNNFNNTNDNGNDNNNDDNDDPMAVFFNAAFPSPSKFDEMMMQAGGLSETRRITRRRGGHQPSLILPSTIGRKR